jgi:hypothetical protein
MVTRVPLHLLLILLLPIVSSSLQVTGEKFALDRELETFTHIIILCHQLSFYRPQTNVNITYLKTKEI